MPAPDLATLFQFEKQIEEAAVAALTAVLPGVQVIRERDNTDQVTPRVSVKLQLGASTGQAKALPGAVYHPAQTLPSAFHGQLIFETVTNRKSANNGSRHDELLGKARVAALLALGSINTHLAWLSLRLITEAGVVPVTIPQTDLDMSPDVFAIQFCIRSDAWPALPSVG